MGIEDLAIGKFFDWIADGINDNIENAILNGLVWIGLFIVILWFMLYIIFWGFINGSWIRNLVIIGIWIVIELANWIGGGHN